jgi:hypothetical protein
MATSETTSTPAPSDEAEAESAAADIQAEWADEYPADAELFCAVFDAGSFDTVYGDEYIEGSTVAVRRFAHKPSPGWVRRHMHLSDMARTFKLLEQHSSPKALAVIDSLTEDAWDEFLGAWVADGGAIDPGKSPKSSQPAGSTKTP